MTISPRRLAIVGIIALALTSIVGGAWAFWSTISTAGGNGAAKATSLTSVSGLTVTPYDGTMVVQWDPATLSDGTTPVLKYVVKRYPETGNTPVTVTSNCTGTIANYGCIENNVPVGNWRYSVTPYYATNWVGPESTITAVVASTGLPPANNVWMWITP